MSGLDVVNVSAEVRESLVALGLSRVKGRKERFSFGSPEDRGLPYIEVGTSHGEVRLRLYRSWEPGAGAGTWDILRAEAAEDTISTAVARGWGIVRAVQFERRVGSGAGSAG